MAGRADHLSGDLDKSLQAAGDKQVAIGIDISQIPCFVIGRSVNVDKRRLDWSDRYSP